MLRRVEFDPTRVGATFRLRRIHSRRAEIRRLAVYRRHRIAEEPQAVPFGGDALTGPARVLEPIDMPFGVGHQAENSAGRVADSRNGAE